MLIFLVNIAGFLTAATILLGTAFKPPLMQKALWFTSYYIIMAMILTWVWSLYRLWQTRQPDHRAFFKAHWKGLAFALALTGIIFVSVPKYFRVLSDETNMLSVAKSMTFHKHTELVTEGQWYYEVFWPELPGVNEKRPFLFPFSISVMHSFFGYSINNVFILNFFVLWGVLFCLYLLIGAYLGELWAFSAMILVVAQPVISLSATSGGFEMFNLLFILICALSLRLFLNKPDHQSFITLLLGLAMLTNARYESVLVLVSVLAIIAAFRYIRLEYFTRSPVIGLIPFFFLPWIWQRIIMVGVHDDLPGGTWVKAFGIENVGTNVPPLLKYAFDLTGKNGFAGAINYLGLLAALYLVVIFFKNSRQRTASSPRAILAVVGMISAILLLWIVLLYSDGIVTKHPMNGRFFIPQLTALSVLSICALAHLCKNQARLAVAVFLGATALFTYYHPVAVEDSLTNRLIIIREHRYAESFMKKHADKNSLFIIERPGQMIVYNCGAIAFATANRRAWQLQQQWRNHLYSHIFVVQAILYNTRQPMPGQKLDPSLTLTTVEELQTNSDHFLRVSEITGVNARN